MVGWSSVFCSASHLCVTGSTRTSWMTVWWMERAGWLKKMGWLLGFTQTGYVQNYALVIFGAIAVIYFLISF